MVNARAGNLKKPPPSQAGLLGMIRFCRGGQALVGG